MSLKVKNKINIKNKYNYEAPLMTASLVGSLKSVVNVESIIDINSIIVQHPKETYLVKVSGESMINEGINDGDILVVDSKEEPKVGQVIISSLNGEMTVKKFNIIDGKVYLISANEKFYPIEILDMYDFKIQGVVKYVIKNV